MSNNMILKIAANTTELLTGMNKATRSIQTFQKKTAKYLKMAAGAFAGFTVGNKFTTTMQEVANLGSEINNSAKQINSSVEYYQKIANVFEQVGSNGNNAVDGIKQFNKILGDIRAGGSANNKTLLEGMGLDATELSLMRVSDRMDLVINKIGAMSNQTDRARAAAQLFGEFTGRVFTGLTSDMEEYRRMFEEATRFVIPDYQIQALDKLNTGFNNISASYDKLKASIASSSIGAIFNDSLKSMTDFILGLSNSESKVSQFVANLAGYFNVIKELLKQAGYGWAELQESVYIAVEKILVLAQKFQRGWNTALASVAKTIRNWSSEIYAATDGNQFLQPLADGAQSLMVQMHKTFTSSQEDIRTTTAQIDKLNQSIEGHKKTIKDMDNSWSITTAWDKGVQAVKQLTAEFHNTKTIVDKTAESVNTVNTNVSNTSSKVKAANDKIKDDYKGMVNILDNSLSGFFDNLMDGSAKWGDFFKGILKEIAAELIRIMFIQKLTGAISGAFGASGAGVQAYAKGGIVNTPTLFSNGGTPSIMGEAGPEAILPLTRTSNGDLGVKATPTNVVVNNYSSNEVEVQQNGNDIEITIAKIADDIQRGGMIGNSIESRYGLQKR